MEWKDIPGYEGKYKASSNGEVIGPRGQKSIWRNNNGYLMISLDGPRKHFSMHRLLLRMFTGDPPSPKHHCMHINGDREDNRLENLRWGTARENHFDKKNHGTFQRGSKHGMSTMTESDVERIVVLCKQWCTPKQISDWLSLTPAQVYSAIRGATWVHVTGGPIPHNSSHKPFHV